MEKFFKLKEHNTTVKTELFGGATTFLSMVYILAVNPSILAASGMQPDAVFTATAIAAAFGTIFMGVFANYPIALASAMGLNAYFASVCTSLGIERPWEVALAAIFVEGIIFMLLSLANFREKLVDDIPKNLKFAITSGIGLFIANIALVNAKIVVIQNGSLSFGDAKSAPVVLAFFGIIITAYLAHKGISGAILFGILITWGLGMIAELIGWYVPDAAAGLPSVFPNFSLENFVPATPYFLSFNFDWIGGNFIKFLVIVFSFLFVEVFDTVGTLIGVAHKADLLREDGSLPRAKQAFLADAIGTTAGACFGTSTTSAFVESTAGVAVGAKTGLASVATGVLFIVALFLSPIFLAIPTFATAPALVYVGFLMMQSVGKIDFHKSDIADTISAFLGMIMMPLTQSIANGIMFGILSWIILKLIIGKGREIPPVMWVSGALFLVYVVIR